MSEFSVEYEREMSDDVIISFVKDGKYEYLALLIERYMPVIKSSAAKFQGSGCDEEELIQEGRLAVFSAIKSYDSSKSSFPTFVNICISRALSSYIRVFDAKRRIPDKLITYIDEENDFADENSPEKIFFDKESYKTITETIKNRLSDLEYSVLCGFLSGKSYYEIAKKEGISVKSADNALKRVRAKIKSM